MEDTSDNHIEPQREALPTPLPNNYTCQDCDRAFKSQPALNMHRVRKHSGKTWSTTGNFAGTDKGAKRKAYKKQYDLKKKAERTAPVSSGVAHCPNCGIDLQPYNLAKAAVDRFNENA